MAIRHLLHTFVILVGLSATSKAQGPPVYTMFQYQFADASGIPITTNSYTVFPGADFTISVYLQQISGDASFLTSENGLFSAGVRATYGSGSPASGQTNPSPINVGGLTGVVSVTSVSNVLNTNPGFNDTMASNAARRANPDFAEMANVSDLVNPVLFSPIGGVGARVLVGTFVFTASNAPGTTNLKLETIPQRSDTVTFTNFLEVDPQISSRSMTIHVVPEPHGLFVLAASLMVAATVTEVEHDRRRRPSS